jgi:cbb3-type cytochrome oxidase cytochrome c subunit
MENFHQWLHNKEAIWLFYVLIAELLVSSISLVVLVIEYFYDKALNDHVKAMKKRTRKRFEFDSLTTGESK